ncbi:D-alanyl-D-alanine carboxypeptidase [Rhizobium alvei]|uniref:D-alanyl-D-alanine carboxypeptidase n=1 Tax=Rhizobium alvei TaxID=1132659 RepID=A0ABT8YRQ7_9HYPH|nr:D-alanyl-D-alanine carboxypeptidase [Rhizobium alvei]MDO6965845.1 D-alanyl-D-alanine carboxypeptidase [Rhizobium alvei]
MAAVLVMSPTHQAEAGPKPASIVVDARTGKVMFQEDPDGLRYPASLTKMMTLYMVFDALESGRISLRTPVPVSKHAAAQAPSKLGVRSGQTFTVEQGILALVTRSANDCATAFAEFLGGTEPRFGKMMTAKARALGMTRTVYHNANGLPDARQVTTARDQAKLSAALRKHFPQYYGYFSTRSFKYGRQVIGNHNRLLGAVKGVDGIKTGFTRAAGFNLATSAQIDGRSIVAVVLGSPSGAARNAKMTRLVQAYLPKASRRGGDADAFVASERPVSEKVLAYAEPVKQDDVEVASATRAIELPTNGPVPDVRYEEEVVIKKSARETKVASIAETSAIELPKTTAVEDAPIPATPVANDNNKVDELTTASTDNGSKGWVIQVGAAPGKKEAMALLQKAQDKGGKVLRSATPFTVAYVKGNEQVYRARFGGFSGQDAAVNACKALKRKGIGCWASLQ